MTNTNLNTPIEALEARTFLSVSDLRATSHGTDAADAAAASAGWWSGRTTEVDLRWPGTAPGWPWDTAAAAPAAPSLLETDIDRARAAFDADVSAVETAVIGADVLHAAKGKLGATHRPAAGRDRL